MENVYANIRSVADSEANVRAEFIKKTYLHLGLAVLAFVGVECFLFSVPGLAEKSLGLIGGSWLIVLVAFMGVSWISEKWARSSTSVGMQYAGLLLFVLAEALIFLPLLFMAANFAPPGTIMKAAVVTGITFGGLTIVPFTTKQDFSFLGTGLRVLAFLAFGLIVVSIFTGWNMGNLFSFAMVAFAAGCILYQTSGIMRHYHPGQHVAAALGLFASVALLFWYILRIFMSRD